MDLSKPLEEIVIRIDGASVGERLDQALLHFLTWRSRSSIHRLIRGGFVSLEGREARPARRMRAGDVVRIRIPKRPQAQARPAPDDSLIRVLFEDAFIVAVDKPAGLAVHPSGRRVHGTLIHYLHRRYRQPSNPGEDVVPRLLHRLDVETSGVVAASLHEDFHGIVARQFEAREVKKQYLAVVHGRPSPEEGLIDLGIGPDRRSPVRLKLEARRDGSGIPALTRYRLLRDNGRFSLVELMPKTGRTHQLRVHLAAIGCPVVGDKIYGGDERIFLEHLRGELSASSCEKLILNRHALHSHRLRYHHPFRDETMELVAELPADMAELMDRPQPGDCFS